MQALADALALVRESWEPQSTAGNLALINQARKDRNELPPWAQEIVDGLLRRASN